MAVRTGGGRPKGTGKGPKAGRGPTPDADRTRRRAEELHGSGMPFQMAMAVAHGKMDLSEALERMAMQDRASRLMAEHGFSRALAMQIALGHADLDTVLQRRRFEEHRDLHRRRSVLEVARDEERPLALGLHGKERLIATVREVGPYSAVVVPQGGEPREVHKLQLKFAHDPNVWKVVRKAQKTDRDLERHPKEPAVRPQDRYGCSDKRMFRYLDERVEVQVTLLEGEVFRGRVTWFGRYEFGLNVKGGAEVTIFRHAMHHVGEVD